MLKIVKHTTNFSSKLHYIVKLLGLPDDDDDDEDDDMDGSSSSKKKKGKRKMVARMRKNLKKSNKMLKLVHA